MSSVALLAGLKLVRLGADPQFVVPRFGELLPMVARRRTMLTSQRASSPETSLRAGAGSSGASILEVGWRQAATSSAAQALCSRAVLCLLRALSRQWGSFF